MGCCLRHSFQQWVMCSDQYFKNGVVVLLHGPWSLSVWVADVDLHLNNGPLGLSHGSQIQSHPCTMGPPIAGGATHQVNPLKPHLLINYKITVCSRRPATQDNGPDPASSSHGLPPDEVQLPLHATLQRSLEHIEAFLADEAKEMGINLHRQVRRLRKSKNGFARKKSTSKHLQTKRQMRKMRMKIIGRATMSSCFEPVF